MDTGRESVSADAKQCSDGRSDDVAPEYGSHAVVAYSGRQQAVLLELGDAADTNER